MFIGESESLSFAMMGSVANACVYPCISALPAIVNALTQRLRYYSSLGVHISFVRSVAMDSWNPKQLLLMKAGGNAKCAAFLSQKGVPATMPIKQKYESPAAQLYKEVLRARVEGTPEPTELPKASNPTNSSTGSQQSHQDPNGLQRLLGETDDQYIIRQTRLKEEARQRMALKFGGNGQQGSRMAGIGSDPNYGNGGNSGGGNSGGSSGGSNGGGGSSGSSHGLTGDALRSGAGRKGSNENKGFGKPKPFFAFERVQQPVRARTPRSNVIYLLGAYPRAMLAGPDQQFSCKEAAPQSPP